MEPDRFSCLCKRQQLGRLPTELRENKKRLTSHCEVVPQSCCRDLGGIKGGFGAILCTQQHARRRLNSHAAQCCFRVATNVDRSTPRVGPTGEATGRRWPSVDTPACPARPTAADMQFPELLIPALARDPWCAAAPTSVTQYVVMAAAGERGPVCPSAACRMWPTGSCAVLLMYLYLETY